MFENTIEYILSHDSVTKKSFLGVFARDELPIIKNFPACFVVNTDVRSRPGQHWLAFYFDQREQCFFLTLMACRLVFTGSSLILSEQQKIGLGMLDACKVYHNTADSIQFFFYYLLQETKNKIFLIIFQTIYSKMIILLNYK
jgi:hypothetical protein